MDKPVAAAPTGAKEKVEKQARQLAYDVRYKTKQAMAQKSGGKMDPAQVQRHICRNLPSLLQLQQSKQEQNKC